MFSTFCFISRMFRILHKLRHNFVAQIPIDLALKSSNVSVFADFYDMFTSNF